MPTAEGPHKGQDHRPDAGNLDVAKSHSRPHTSNDNPFSEAHFKTLKDQPDFSKRFGCIQAPRTSAAASSPGTTRTTALPASTDASPIRSITAKPTPCKAHSTALSA